MQRPAPVQLLLLALILFALPVAAAEEQASNAALLRRAAELPAYEPLWELGDELASRQDDAAVQALREAAASERPGQALAAGYALLRLAEHYDGAVPFEDLISEGTVALESLVRRQDAPVTRRLEAAAVLGSEGGEYAARRIRVLMGDETLPPVLQVEVAKSLWRLTRGQSAADRLRALLDSESPAARYEAALALATFSPAEESRQLLADLVFRPGSQGRRARRLLYERARLSVIQGREDTFAPLLRRLAQYPSLDLGNAGLLLQVSQGGSLDPGRTQNQYAAELLAEIAAKVQRYYPADLSGTEAERKRELERLEPANLATDAAKTFVGMVDPFSAFLDEADLASMNEQLTGNYGGIGAWVGMHRFLGEDRFTILVPMYNKPAWRAGLRAMDWVEEIDGEPIGDLTMGEIIKRLKGQPNTKVRLLVHRRGWTKPREFTVTRRKIDVPSVRYRMLPEKIGYIRLQRFGDVRDTVEELNAAIDDLEGRGMQALVLDLSDNPGGLLKTAIQVCDLFLEPDRLIVYSMGRPESNLPMHRRQDYYARRAPRTRRPMAVLINGGSASASEIVAGALRDHQRATLVGEKSFGKGSIQSLIDIRTTGPESQLKLTVAKYYLPNGDCIHKKGIDPHIEVEYPELSRERQEAIMAVREKMFVFDYVRETVPRHSDRFRELFAFDADDLDAYPEIEALRQTIREAGIEIEPRDLRREIRQQLMTYLQSEKGEDMVVDPQTNLRLQRAILELRKQLPREAETSPLYAWMEKQAADRRAEPTEETAAAAETAEP
jgi:carboxyl-terminal processing protease